jgi:magnesium chelatase subunit D
MSPAWADASLAAALFAIDPQGLGGVVVRAGPGPVRDRWLALTRSFAPADAPVRRIPVAIEDDRLLGGLDLASSLAAGRPIAQRGLLAECDGGTAILPMAERVEAGLAARLAAALDHGEIVVEREGLGLRLAARIGLIALDEGQAPEERPPAALMERLAFHLDLGAIGTRERLDSSFDPPAVAEARARLTSLEPPSPAIVEALCGAAMMYGLDSARAPLLTLRAAGAHAALRGRARIETEDAAVAARLVLGPRALTAPAEAPSQSAEDEPQPDPETAPDTAPDPSREEEPSPDAANPADLVIEAIQAALPEGLLSAANLEGRARAAAARTRGAGASAKSANRGRPIGSRPGTPRGGARLNLVETLRAASPWQKLRSGGATPTRVLVRQEDFRIRKYVQRLESTTIVAVDASGSSASQRLAEAKGAVELLLGKAYVSRAQVALVSFRGQGAEVLLPPTRSLTRAKNRLAEMPGGGGTPLAAGIEAALALALAEKAKDHTPLLVFLTDGRANVTRDGSPGRAAANEDAMAAAVQVRQAGIAAVFIDTSPRAAPDGDRFARAMGAAYAPLPYVDANAVLDLVSDNAPRRP